MESFGRHNPGSNGTYFDLVLRRLNAFRTQRIAHHSRKGDRRTHNAKEILNSIRRLFVSLVLDR